MDYCSDKICRIVIKIFKNFIKLDLEEYLYIAIKNVLSLYSNDLGFPGTRLSKFIIEPDFKMNNFFVESECLSFIFILSELQTWIFKWK